MTEKNLFIWQSFSLFLDEEIVRDSLIKMADLCADGSVIVQDFYFTAFLDGEISKSAKKQIEFGANIGVEPFYCIVEAVKR